MQGTVLSFSLKHIMHCALCAICAICAVTVFVSLPTAAQTAPNLQEIADFKGLHAAAHRGDMAQIEQLIRAKADLNALDRNRRTPLIVASFSRQLDAIRALAKAGADLNALDADRYDAVTITSVADDETTLKLLLQLGASAKTITSRYDGSALIAAAHLGHDGVVRQLIAAGAPLNLVNNLHWTAVIESIVLGNGGPRHQATLKALIDAGASLTLTDRQGNTPLQLAKSRSYSDMVKMLELAGAK